MKLVDRLLNLTLLLGIVILIILQFIPTTQCNHEQYEYTLVCSDEGYYISSEGHQWFIPASNSPLDSLMIDINQ